MYKARKQASFRKKIAYLFYFLAAVNAILKLTGVLVLDASMAITSTEAMGIKLAFYFLPLVLLAIGIVFNILSKKKMSKADAYDMRGSVWQR